MRKEAKKQLTQLLQVTMITFASVVLLACNSDSTGPELGQSDPAPSELAVGSVSGTIMFRGEAVADVTVIIGQDERALQSTTTGIDGEYTFTGLPAGDYNVWLRNLDLLDGALQDVRRSVSVSGGGHASANFDLFGDRDDGGDRDHVRRF